MANEKIIYMKLSEIEPYENNPRFNDGSVDHVANSIRRFGFKQPLVIDSNNVIIAGHTRFKAAKQIGLSDVPVIVARDLTEEEAQAYRLADNKVGESSMWDFEALDRELAELADFDMSQFGFESVSMEGFSEEFDLPSGDKEDHCTMSFVLSTEQASIVRRALEQVDGDMYADMGNDNRNGNCLAGVCSEWLESKR